MKSAALINESFSLMSMPKGSDDSQGPAMCASLVGGSSFCENFQLDSLVHFVMILTTLTLSHLHRRRTFTARSCGLPRIHHRFPWFTPLVRDPFSQEVGISNVSWSFSHSECLQVHRQTVSSSRG
jgi:hypothetical protein